MKPEQAVSACVRSLEQRRLSSRQVRDILRCDEVDVTPIEPFLNSSDSIIRASVVAIIGEKGNMDRLVEHAKVEKERHILMHIIQAFVDRPEGVEKIVQLLESNDGVVFEETIDMFRRVGRADCLFGLIFSQDKELVERVKRYINDQRKASSPQR